MPKTSFALISMLSFAYLASGCALKPPNSPLCVEVTITRGTCTRIVSGDTFDVDEDHKFEGRSWWDLKPVMIQMPASTWRDIKTYIIEVCKKTNQCDESVTNWQRTINNIDSSIDKNTP